MKTVDVSTATELRGTGSSPRALLRGFTLLEIVIGMLVAGAAILVALAMAGSMSTQTRGQRAVVATQENVRVALEDMTRMLRSAGSGADHSRGQGRFVYAGPFTVGFNVNMQPLDDPSGTGTPTALDPSLESATVPLDGGDSYTPPRTFTTGAETVVLTFDSDRDGQLTDADLADDAEEDSENPHDVVLKAFSYGSDGTGNVVTSSGLALLRGPEEDQDTGVTAQPLFSYWIDTDNDASTPPDLHGDENQDRVLSASEIQAMGPVANDEVALIERIDLTATAETEKPTDGGDYKATILRSAVSFRNRNVTAARVVGTVFHDADRDGVRSADEIPLRDVIVRSSNGVRSRTGSDGHYSLALTPGTYTIQEIDPAGFTSTTSNTVAVNIGPGEYVEVNFGDVSSAGIGRIRATVYNDANHNTQFDTGELPIRGVRVFLDNGAELDTDLQGQVVFAVTTGSYTVTEVDSTNYASTTPNVVDVNVTSEADTVEVEFGDYRVEDSGTIHGIVYHDENNDATRDNNEAGVANVTIMLDDAETVVTSSTGEFTFTASPGTHTVTEADPPGYTSSTVNTVTVVVVSRETVEVEFGDIAQQDVHFQEIVLGTTERALSIATLDTGEDNKSDTDFVLGTHYSGSNDILVWWNNRVNSSTPNSSLFTATASYARVIDSDVNALAIADLNGDGRGDVIGAQGTSSNNITVWIMQGTLLLKGRLPTTPTVRYSTTLATAVNDVVTGHFDSDGVLDFAVGTTTGLGTGKLEVWHGSGGSDFRRDTGDIYVTLPGSLLLGLGEVVTLAAADFNGDGDTDLALGCRTSASLSTVHVLTFDRERRRGSDFDTMASFPVAGQIQDLLGLELYEDDRHDVDLVVATETASDAGLVQVWHNRSDGGFGDGDIPNLVPNDVADPGGSPLSLAAPNVDNDIFPDLLVGTRTGPSFTGGLVLYRAYGYLPATGTLISTTSVGEVITMAQGDLNRDGSPDIAAGTRTSGSSGRVILYYNVRPSI